MLMFLQLPSPEALASNEPRLLLNGQDITTIASPIIQNDRTLVPIRFIAEQLGAQVKWNNEDRTVNVVKGNASILLRINSHLVSYESGENGEKAFSLCDVPPTIINERTYVPLRLVSNALGIGVDWDGATNTILIDSSKRQMLSHFLM